MAFHGWALVEEDRSRLLAMIPPVYPDVVAHHVTLALGRFSGPMLTLASVGHVVGYADDGAGVQALVVEIDGTITRPDGQVFHITWSIDKARGRKPADAKAVVATWIRLSFPISIGLIPAQFNAKGEIVLNT